MKIRAMSASLALALAGYAAGANALEPSAVLRQMQGRVFADQATTVGLARDGLPLYAGNRVVAVAGGRAEVVYPDGCTVAVPENSLLAIGAPEQCRQGRARVRTIDGFQDTRIGQAGPLPASGSSGGDRWDARLEQPKGSTFVEENGVRAPAKQNMGVENDTRLITQKNSEVTVVFKGCEVEVGPGESVKVEDLRARCNEGVLDGGKTGKELVAGLKQPRGEVFVGEGSGRAAVSSRRPVVGDDLIVTGANSRVVVVFDGCQTRVGEDKDVLVKDLSSLCVAGFLAGTGAAAGAAGVTGAAGFIAGPTIIAVAGAATVAGAIASTNDDDDGPASPQ